MEPTPTWTILKNLTTRGDVFQILWDTFAYVGAVVLIMAAVVMDMVFYGKRSR